MTRRQVVMPILGNQLFPLDALAPHRDAVIVMCEDDTLCRYLRHHQHKLILILAAMREQAAMLADNGFEVRYQCLDDSGNNGLMPFVASVVADIGSNRLRYFDPEGSVIRRRFTALARELALEAEVLPSPMFIGELTDFDAHLDTRGSAHMARYYQRVRRRLGILMDDDNKPEGGRWSFDADNRKRLPRSVTPPVPTLPSPTPIVREVTELVAERFGNHPGSGQDFWIPTTHAAAQAWLREFLDLRLSEFGPYEDALSTRSEFLFHSALSPLMNVGLLTPREIIDAALAHADTNAVPLNSLEGFVRQVIGWREFIRATYRRLGPEQHKRNFWGHTRRPGPAWYTGETGIPPLDDAIDLARRRGWNHHIQRLMVVGNLMTLSGIAPRAARDWFMEMYADAYGWVMGPNVYGMALFSDGGLFATKPYVCGSNYLLKMSDYKKGPWCDVVDGLYWRFISTHRDFFESNPRLAVITRHLDAMSPDRWEDITGQAEAFIDTHTCAA